MMNNDAKAWLRDHNIKVVDTNKRAAKYPKFDLGLFTNPVDYNEIKINASVFDTEILYTVEIPESELHRMCDFENQVFGHMKNSGHYNLFEYLMNQKEEEKALRTKYPAVQQAYEHYSLMLKMAQSNEL